MNLSEPLGLDPNPKTEAKIELPERMQSYQDEHPTHFNWRADVRALVNKYQAIRRFRWKTYANTYWDHPPGYHLDAVSVDFWGGGLDASGRYLGYRGKQLPKELGDDLHKTIFNDPALPRIWWIIWQGWLWTDTGGWQKAPWGPADSDPDHLLHIHVTFK